MNKSDKVNKKPSESKGISIVYVNLDYSRYCYAFLMDDVLCLCCGIWIEMLSVDIKPFMEYMKNRINVHNGLNVMDPILEGFRFTNVKRNLDPGSVYVVDELCAYMIEVFITIHLTLFRIFNMDATFVKEIKIDGITENNLASILFNCGFYRYVSISMVYIIK